MFSDGAGDCYVVTCDPSDRTGVIGFINDEPEQEVEYVSLGTMFETLAECFAQDAFFVRRRIFEVDDEKHRRIATRGSWNTSTSNPYGVQQNGANGVLYKCTDANTWTLYYTPYTYPHPLTQTQTAPAAPINLRVN